MLLWAYNIMALVTTLLLRARPSLDLLLARTLEQLLTILLYKETPVISASEQLPRPLSLMSMAEPTQSGYIKPPTQEASELLSLTIRPILIHKRDTSVSITQTGNLSGTTQLLRSLLQRLLEQTDLLSTPPMTLLPLVR